MNIYEYIIVNIIYSEYYIFIIIYLFIYNIHSYIMYSFIYNIYYIFIYMCVYKYSFLMSGIYVIITLNY